MNTYRAILFGRKIYDFLLELTLQKLFAKSIAALYNAPAGKSRLISYLVLPSRAVSFR